MTRTSRNVQSATAMAVNRSRFRRNDVRRPRYFKIRIDPGAAVKRLTRDCVHFRLMVIGLWIFDV